MAYIRQLPSGRWQATVRVSPTKRVTATRLLKKEARDWAREQEQAIARGEWRDPRLARIVFEDWFERWWAARVLEPETLVGQRSTVDRHVLPHWRGWTLGSIGRIEVQSWVATMQKDGKGPQLVAKAYGIFRAAMNAAVDEDLIGRSPCRNITLPTAAKAQPRFYEPAQLALIVAELPEPHATVALVMAWCGLRWEEVAALDVPAVRALRRELAVERVVTRAQRVKPYPKSAAGHRTVPAPQHVLDRLAPYWQAAKDGDTHRQGKSPPVRANSDGGEDSRAARSHRTSLPGSTQGGERPASEPYQLLFRSRDGRSLSYPAWWSAWQNAHKRLAARRAEVPDFTPHALRHTAASWWVQQGVPIYEVKHLLGHSRIESTEVYAHLAPGVHRSVREAWAAIEDASRDAAVTHETRR